MVKWLRSRVGRRRDATLASMLSSPATHTEFPAPIAPRVLMIIHNPALQTRGGKTLREFLGWADPNLLAEEYVQDVRECSFGCVDYKIVDRVVVDAFPLKRDGFRYTEQSYLEARRTRRFHDPDGVDYHALVGEFDLVGRVDRDEIDEVWLFGGPGFGYWESMMAGPEAFWCNAPPLDDTHRCSRRFVIMGFNYERGVGEMLEDLGHRAESMLRKVFEHTRGDANLFERFTRYDATHPGRAEVGTVHFAPNSAMDYDWGNPRSVLSRCDSWLYFPDLTGQPRLVSCRDWGNGDIREHHRWWLRHFPHIVGEAGGLSWNWWEYVIDPNRVP